MTTCGEAVLELLSSYGVDTVFGIPGVHTLELYRGLAHSTLRHVTPWHEQGAGFMADGYARATGKPAACFVISGPGVTNMATAMAQAKSDSIPMLVVASVVNSKKLGNLEGLLHELPDQRGLIQQCCVYSQTVRHVNDLTKIFAEAFSAMLTGRKGPAYIEIPVDILGEAVGEMETHAHPLPSPPDIEAKQVKGAAALLRAAKNPIVLLGGGAIDARDAVVDLIDKIGAPVVNTTNAKGVLPLSHPLRVGGSPSDADLQNAIAAADVVLAVGTEYAETDYDFFFQGHKKPTGKVIRIDVDRNQLEKNMGADVAIHGDAAQALVLLSDTLEDFVLEGERGRGALKRANALRSQVLEAADPSYRALFSIIDAALPNAVIAADSTQPAYHAVLHWERASPRSFFTSATGYGTLGFGLPAAIGAKLAMPDRPVICLTGDGGLQFTLGELATAAEAKASIIILLWNNEGYGEIENSMERAGIIPVGVRHAPINYLNIAEGMGCHIERATTLQDLSALLHEVQNETRPTLIELRERDFVHPDR